MLFVKPLEDTTPRVNANVSYGLLVMMMGICGLIDCNKYTTLVQDADSW